MKLSVAAMAALALAASSVARAEFITVTYTGMVTTGVDNMDLFGGGSLVGDPYTAVYTINTSLGVSAFASNRSLIIGTGLPGPVTEVLTIDGQSYFAQPGAGLDQTARLDGWNPGFPLFGLTGGPYYGFTALIQGSDGLQSGNYIMSNNPVVDSPDFRQPDSYSIRSGDSSIGAFQICTNPLFELCDGLVMDSATVSVVDVPEPGVWVLILAGFGAVGLAVRRKISDLRPALSPNVGKV